LIETTFIDVEVREIGKSTFLLFNRKIITFVGLDFDLSFKECKIFPLKMYRKLKK